MALFRGEADGRDFEPHQATRHQATTGLYCAIVPRRTAGAKSVSISSLFLGR
jgi:hypothetical protein